MSESHFYRHLLAAALEATDDPEGYAKTLLSALVKSKEGGLSVCVFAVFLPPMTSPPKLRLAGTDEGAA